MKTWWFFIPWFAFSSIALVAAGVFYIWARRSGQYKEQDRARYLPLWAYVPDDAQREERNRPAKETEHQKAET